MALDMANAGLGDVAEVAAPKEATVKETTVHLAVSLSQWVSLTATYACHKGTVVSHAQLHKAVMKPLVADPLMVPELDVDALLGLVRRYLEGRNGILEVTSVVVDGIGGECPPGDWDRRRAFISENLGTLMLRYRNLVDIPDGGRSVGDSNYKTEGLVLEFPLGVAHGSGWLHVRIGVRWWSDGEFLRTKFSAGYFVKKTVIGLYFAEDEDPLHTVIDGLMAEALGNAPLSAKDKGGRLYNIEFSWYGRDGTALADAQNRILKSAHSRADVRLNRGSQGDGAAAVLDRLYANVLLSVNPSLVADAQRFVGMCYALAGEKGYQPGWAYRCYAARFPCCPLTQGEFDAQPPATPDSPFRLWVKAFHAPFAVAQYKRAYAEKLKQGWENARGR